MALAATGALFVLLAGELSRGSWHLLSSATLHVTAWLLSLYEADVLVDLERKLVAVRDFSVIVTPECSGYEGIGLMIAFLSLYLWIFRNDLRFPNAFFLLPVGIVAIWLLNAARIAALTSIGAHVSSAVAADGFHSQAGWIAFLIVTLGLMAAAHGSRYFRHLPASAELSGVQADRMLHALLLPFIALMATSVVASAFAPHDQWLYGLKVVVVGAVLWWFRDAYRDLASRVSPVSVAVGLAIGAAWVATAPQEQTPLAAWLHALPAATAAAWIALRVFGAVVIVPVAEELAFRGYLPRLLSSSRFDIAAPVPFTWLSFVVSSVLFGVLHQRWIAGTLAGAAYALLMYRTGRLSDPIAAHMSSNATIALWAFATGHLAVL